MKISSINPTHLARVAARVAELRNQLMAVIPSDIEDFTLEIGCGHGHFLTKLACLNPAHFFVGIDILGDRLRKAERKQMSAGANNLRFIKAEAEEFLECLPARFTVKDVIVLFPDPWPKKRHHKNRLIQNVFLNCMAARMRRGGHLYFRTDHEPYLQWSRDILSNHPSWVIVPNASWLLEEETVFQAKAAHFGSLVAAVRTLESQGKPVG